MRATTTDVMSIWSWSIVQAWKEIFLRYLETVEQMRNSKTLRMMCMRNTRVQFGFVWKDDGYALVIKQGLLEHAPFSSMDFSIDAHFVRGFRSFGTAGPNLCPKVDALLPKLPDCFWSFSGEVKFVLAISYFVLVSHHLLCCFKL